MFDRFLKWLGPRPSEGRPSDAADFWYRDVASPSESGVVVTDDKALAVATFFACLRVLSQSIASMPLLVYRRLDDGGKQRAVDSDWYEVLHERPNSWQTPAEWKQLGMAWLILRGNWYCRIIRGLGMRRTELLPLHPDRMQVKQRPDGQLDYYYRPNVGQTIPYAARDILHVRGLSLDGVVGVSVLTYARNAVGLSSAQEAHGSRLFANGSLPPFALETPEPLNERAIGNFRAGWRGMHAGARNAHNPPILQGGMKLHELSLTNEDSQWLESRKFQAEEICRFTGVPPHMAGILDRATFSNIEHQGIDYVRYTLRPWATLWQQAAKRDLIWEPDLFAEFLLDDLQRGDTPSRYGAYNIGLQSGFLTRNEVRSWENLNPIDGGDTPLEPLNMGPIGQRDAPQSESTPEPPRQPDDGEQPRRRKARRGRARESRLRRAFLPLLRDAGQRIAAAECKGLASRVAKAGDDPERWRTWASEWYEGHVAYAVRALQPLADSWREQTGRRLAVGEVCGRLRDEALRELRERDPQQVLREWKEIRAQHTAAWLERELL